MRIIASIKWRGKKSAGELPVVQNKLIPPCIHRGKLLDKTTCKCSVWACAIHGTCSNNIKAGVKLCKGCSDYKALDP